MSEQATSEQTEQGPTNGGRQCSGCHRRNADLTLFENGKLYCTSCAGNVSRLGIEPVIRDDRSTAIAAGEPEGESNLTSEPEPDDEYEVKGAEHEEVHVMASQPVKHEEIAVMPSLATSSVEVPSTTPLPAADVSLHGVLAAERARLLEQRSSIERQFRADVESIDDRLAHVESLLGDQPDARAS